MLMGAVFCILHHKYYCLAKVIWWTDYCSYG